MDITRDQTAYHEAGHAIGHICIGNPFTKMSIVSAEDYLGIVTWNLWADFDPDVQTDIRTIRRAKQWIVSIWSGPIAESIYTKSNPTGSGEDYQRVRKMGLYLSGSPEEAEADLNYAYKKIKKMLQSNWSAIERLAQELHDKKTLTYRVVKKTVGPFLTIPPNSFLDSLFIDDENDSPTKRAH